MIWQDVAIMAIQAGFCFALIPAILDEHKPSYRTSFLNTILCTFLGIVFLTLEFWFSATITFMAATLWGILFYQKIKGRFNSSF